MTKPEGYSFLAQYYDEIMDNDFYERMFSYLAEIISKYDINCKKVLDLGAGTGKFSIYFALQGSEVKAIEKSPQMLEEAKNRIEMSPVSERVDLEMADMRELDKGPKFTVAFCLFDGINYLLDEESVFKAFKSVFNALSGNSYFIFDVNTIDGLRYGYGDAEYIKEFDEGTSIWSHSWNEERKIDTIEIKLFIRQDENLYKLREEKHREKGHYARDLRRLLHRAGFQDVDIFKCFTFSSPKRAHKEMYIAKKGLPEQLSLKL